MIAIRVAGTKDALDSVNRFTSTSFISSLLEALGQDAVRDAKENIENAKDVSGAPFTPLAMPRAFRANYPGNRGGSNDHPLLNSGELLRSITSGVLGTELTVGASMYYAGFHQKGTRVIPRRMFIHEDARFYEQRAAALFKGKLT